MSPLDRPCGRGTVATDLVPALVIFLLRYDATPYQDTQTLKALQSSRAFLCRLDALWGAGQVAYPLPRLRRTTTQVVPHLPCFV